MNTTIKTALLSLFVLVSTLSFAGSKNKKVVSSELNVVIATIDDAKVMVRFQKLEGEVVRVRIFDAEGNLIYADRDVDSRMYAKSFDLSAFPAGQYRYKVENDLYTVTKVVEKN